MVSQEIENKRSFEPQARLEWYHMVSFLKSLGQTAVRLELSPSDLIHIGGNAQFYHLLEAVGSAAFFHFRGTHDVDLLSFKQGVTKQLLDTMATRSIGDVSDYEIRRSPNLPDKKSGIVSLSPCNDPALPTRIAIDVFEPSDKLIHYNRRILSKDRLIFDPPRRLDLPWTYGTVNTPSTRDIFIMKMDVIDFSQSGLRAKDMLDILSIFRVCEVWGFKTDYLLDALIEDAETCRRKIRDRKDIHRRQQNKMEGELDDSTIRKFICLEKVLTIPPCIRNYIPTTYPLLPSQGTITESFKSVNRFCKEVNGIPVLSKI